MLEGILKGLLQWLYGLVLEMVEYIANSLSSLFFSCLFTRLTDYARREGINGRLPVCVNFLLEEFCT